MQVQQLYENAFTLQHDWFEDPGSKFFLGYRKFEEKTDFVNVCLKRGDFEFEKPQSVYTVSQEDRHLRLSLGSSTSTLFVHHLKEIGSPTSTPIVAMDLSFSTIVFAKANTIVVRNLSNGNDERFLEGHVTDITRCKLFPSKMVVLSCGTDRSIRIWSPDTGECHRTMLGQKGPVTDVSPIGVGAELLSVGGDGRLIKWSCADGAPVKSADVGKGELHCLVVSEDGTTAIVGCSAGFVLYDVATLEPLPINANVPSEKFGSAIVSACFGAGRVIFVGGEDGTVSRISFEEGTVRQLSTRRGSVQRLAAPSEGLYAAFQDGSMVLYASTLDREHPMIEFLGLECDTIYDFAFMSKGELITGSREGHFRRYPRLAVDAGGDRQ